MYIYWNTYDIYIYRYTNRYLGFSTGNICKAQLEFEKGLIGSFLLGGIRNLKGMGYRTTVATGNGFQLRLPWKPTCPLKKSGWKTTFVLKWHLFRRNVSFRGCKREREREREWERVPRTQQTSDWSAGTIFFVRKWRGFSTTRACEGCGKRNNPSCCPFLMAPTKSFSKIFGCHLFIAARIPTDKHASARSQVEVKNIQNHRDLLFVWILTFFDMSKTLGQKGQNAGSIKQLHGNEVMSFLFFFVVFLFCWIGAMGLATNISFPDDAYPTTLLGKQLEGMRGIRWAAFRTLVACFNIGGNSTQLYRDYNNLISH